MTGAGLVTCLGPDRETTWSAVTRGVCGVGPLQQVESPLHPDKGGGEVRDPDAASGAGAREVHLLKRALDQALADAGIAGTGPYRPERCAVALGTTLHGMRHGGDFLRRGDASRLRRFLAGATLAAATEGVDARGLRTTTCSACSSGLASVALGHTLLANGEADFVIAGGYDPISEYSYAGFNAMRLVSAGDIRPFAATRDGMKVAEGYAVVVLERAADAAARGANVLARIVGYGESCDAFHLSKPHPEGHGAAAAMRQAMQAGGVDPDDVDMLVAHATATRDNDASEYAAMRQVFGERLHELPVVGFKSHLGHTLGAAGTVELILSVLAIRDGVVPPCANMDDVSTEFADLRVAAGQKRKARLRYVLNTSLGFGGANASMLIAPPRPAKGAPRPHVEASHAADRDREPVVTGVGAVLPGVIGAEALAASWAPGNRLTQAGPLEVADYEHLINARRTRRMSDYAKLCLAATADAYRDAGITDVARFGEHCHAVVGTTHGATSYCESYYRRLIEEGVDAANPLLFAEGVPNVASAHLSTTFSIRGFCQTLIGTRTAGLEALHVAASRIRSGAWDRAVVVAAEESTALVTRTYAALLAEKVPVARGAVALVLESRAGAEQRGARSRGAVGRVAQTAWCGRAHRARLQRAGALIRRLGPVDVMMLSAPTHAASRWERACLRAARRCADDRAAPPLATLPAFSAELFSVGPLVSIATALLGRACDGPSAAWNALGLVCADWSYGFTAAVIRSASRG